MMVEENFHEHVHVHVHVRGDHVSQTPLHVSLSVNPFLQSEVEQTIPVCIRGGQTVSGAIAKLLSQQTIPIAIPYILQGHCSQLIVRLTQTYM